jgi:type 1 glutamine amidotransferase
MIQVGPSTHPLIRGLTDFAIDDEIYYKLWMDESRNPTHHAWAEWDGAQHPMLTTLDASANVGQAIYIALGHNMRSMEPPAMRRIWCNAVNYLLPLD